MTQLHSVWLLLTRLFSISVVWTGEEVGKGVGEVFTELSKDLRQLKELPLAITSLQGTSPVFRHAEVCVCVRVCVCVCACVCACACACACACVCNMLPR